MKRCMLILLLLTTVVGCAVWAAAASSKSPQESLPKTKINPKDGAELILIPAGEFTMGSTQGEIDAWLQAHPNEQKDWFTGEVPQHTVYLDAYYIYKNDVTVAQYRKFCNATGRAMPLTPGWGWLDNHPMVNVTWDDASAYAHWAGTALPTEAQWEKAARGGDGRVFPWGNEWDAVRCNNSVGTDWQKNHTSSVGSFATGASPYGVQDMAGNVWQWCADWYDDHYSQNVPARNPTGPATGTMRVLHGGNWFCSSPGIFRVAFRIRYFPTHWNFNLGFRCACPVAN